jgi:hypothetical protein
MSKKFSVWYLSLLPVVFFLSWFISHKLYLTFMLSAGVGVQPDRSLIYASVFTALYLAVFIVIKDLYPNQKK